MPSCVSSACQSWLPPELPPMRAAGGTTRRCLSISDSTPVTSTTWEYRDLPINLNLSNRRMRTRMSGGVAGEQRCAAAPYADHRFCLQLMFRLFRSVSYKGEALPDHLLALAP